MAISANLRFYKGEDKVITVSMVPPTNITGWSLQFSVRHTLTDSVLITKTLASGISITDAANGIFTITVDSADTVTLDPGAYIFDIQRIDTGNRTVLTIGNLNLDPEVQL